MLFRSPSAPVPRMGLPPALDAIHVLRAFEVVPVLRLSQPAPLTLTPVGLSASGPIAVLLPIPVAIVRKKQLPAMLALACASSFHHPCLRLLATSSGKKTNHLSPEPSIQQGKKRLYRAEVRGKKSNEEDAFSNRHLYPTFITPPGMVMALGFRVCKASVVTSF